MRIDKQQKVLAYLTRKDVVVNSLGDMWFYVKTQKIWRKRLWNKLPNGYYQCLFRDENGENLAVYKHVLVYLAKTRKLYPEGFAIDHIDRNKENCRWDNLRAVSHRENCANKEYQGHPVKLLLRVIRGKEIEDIKRLMGEGMSQAMIARTLNLNRLTVRYTYNNIKNGKPLKYEGWTHPGCGDN